ncbi:MAG: deoxynucleoside kinase [Lachnospiraceae bacterium]|nr:deoxynucleoside kinase [Lachnospiraceae bacterium]
MDKRIEICGAIASGKTTLTKAFSSITDNLVFEDFSKVSFLDDFYKSPSQYAFETEIAFTLQHYFQLKQASSNHELCVADFSLIGDYAFAQANLSEQEFNIYKQIFNLIIDKIGKPQKLVFLKSASQILTRRILDRGRVNEKTISTDYLNKFEEKLVQAIQAVYINVPVVFINTNEISFSDYSKEFLLKLI